MSECGLYWPSIFKDTYEFCRRCEPCQKTGNLFGKNQMPLHSIYVCEIFDAWGVDFMGPLRPSCGYTYILLFVDYVSKWVEVVAIRTDDAKTVVKNVKSYIPHRYGVPKALISDRGTHFCNQTVGALLAKYHVTHKVSTGYHPQTNGQTEISNREIKSLLEKVVNLDRKDWSLRLEEVLWADWTTYTTPIGMSLIGWFFGSPVIYLLNSSINLIRLLSSATYLMTWQVRKENSSYRN